MPLTSNLSSQFFLQFFGPRAAAAVKQPFKRTAPPHIPARLQWSEMTKPGVGYLEGE